jgi:hypothetical protein
MFPVHIAICVTGYRSIHRLFSSLALEIKISLCIREVSLKFCMNGVFWLLWDLKHPSNLQITYALSPSRSDLSKAFFYGETMSLLAAPLLSYTVALLQDT